MTSSEASKFNSAAHLQFFTCPPTAVSIGNTNPEEKRFQWLYAQCYFPGFWSWISGDFCPLPLLCSQLCVTDWCCSVGSAGLHSRIEPRIFGSVWVIGRHSHSQAAMREPQPGEVSIWVAGREWQKEGKHVLYQNQPSGPTACPVEVGCK